MFTSVGVPEAGREYVDDPAALAADRLDSLAAHPDSLAAHPDSLAARPDSLVAHPGSLAALLDNPAVEEDMVVDQDMR